MSDLVGNPEYRFSHDAALSQDAAHTIAILISDSSIILKKGKDEIAEAQCLTYIFYI